MKQQNLLLFQACSDNDLHQVQQLIKAGLPFMRPDINARDQHGDTPLLIALEKKYIALAKFLLGEGAAVNVKNNYKATPLGYVIRLNNLELLQLMVEKGVSVNETYFDDEIPILRAAMDCSPEIVALLIEKGADVNARGKYFAETPLIIATERRSDEWFDIVKLLIEKGADVNGKNHMGYTPLANSIYLTPNIFKLLLEKGSDINTVDKFGVSVLMHLVEMKKYDLAELLIEKGADLNLKSNKGETALTYAITAGNYAYANYLIEKGATLSSELREAYQQLKAKHETDQKPIAPLERHSATFDHKAFVTEYQDSLQHLRPWSVNGAFETNPEMAKLNAYFGGKYEVGGESAGKVGAVYFWNDAVLEFNWWYGPDGKWHDLVRWFSFDNNLEQFKIYELEYEDSVLFMHLFMEKGLVNQDEFIYGKTWSKLHTGQHEK